MTTISRTHTGQNCPRWESETSQITVQTTNSAERSAGLLNQPSRQRRAACRGADHRRPWGDWQVAPQRIELAQRLGRVGGLRTLLEVLGAEPPGDGMLVELGDELLAVLIGGAKPATAWPRRARMFAHCGQLYEPPRRWQRERLFARLDSFRVDQIVVSGAREHNLKDVTVAIPRDSLTVITGLSGSGKSSLAFDTIYAEGQRRYVESLSAYARQFLGQMDKPDVDSIEGLSPAISIDQKTTSRNPRSTVGTVTEIYDYLRLLWSRIGHPHCHVCGRPITGQSAEQIIDQVMELAEGTRFMVHGPDRPRAQGRVRQAVRGAARRGLRPGQGGR